MADNGKVIFVISPYLPWPLHGGTVVRIFNIIKELSFRGYDIVLLAGSDDCKMPVDNPLQALCREIHLFKLAPGDSLWFKVRSMFSFKPYPFLRFQTDSLKEKLNQLLATRTFDVILANLSFSIDALDVRLLGSTPLLFDHPECEELVYYDYVKSGSLSVKIFSLLNLIKFKILHQRMLLKSDAIICVSGEETEFTKQQVGHQVPVYTIPNGVDMDTFHPEPGGDALPDRIIFCSSMRVKRNADAARWFATTIFPDIKNEFPSSEFWIIGSSPTPEIMELGLLNGIKVVGTVPAMADYYRMGKVFVAPYHFGAGTKLKVLEAMASGVPVVSTNIGCRGIDVINNEHVLIADTEKEFSRSVARLLEDRQICRALSEKALALVINKYTWKKLVDQLELIMVSVMEKNQS